MGAMALIALHYTGLLPLAALVLSSSAALAALRDRRRLYTIVTGFSLLALAAGAALEIRSGGSPVYAALALGLGVAAAALSSLYRGDPGRLFRYAAYLVVAGWVIYWIPFVTLDFSLHEVFWNTSPGLPTWMRFAAAWSGGGGSLFLFSLFAALGGLYLLRGGSERRSLLVAGASAVLAVGLAAAFLNDAFTRLEEIPASGAGLNPLLKSPWLYPHPLSTFGGYALLAIAGVGLLAGAERRRGWVVYELGWALLTAGIMLGGYWSYETFGWGGYWAWDPVETSELMVWLAATFLPHVAVVARSMTGFAAAFMSSSVFLAMYVTRTGLSPLHSFAAPGIGALILFASGVVMLAYSLFRLALAGDRVVVEYLRSLRSRKPYLVGLAVAGAALLASALFVYATLFVPSTLVLKGEQVSVPQMDAGIKFFHPVLYPLLLVMLAAIPLAFTGEWLGWRGYAALVVTTALGSAVFAASVLKGYYDLAPLSPKTTEAMMAAGLPWAGVALASTLAYLFLRLRRGGRLVLFRDRLVPLSLLHLGLAVTVIGVLLSGTYAFNQAYTWEAHLKPGDTITVPGGYRVQLVDYRFGISSSMVDIYTNYVGRSSIYFYAQQGLQTLANDLGHLVTLYEQGRSMIESNGTLRMLSTLSQNSPYSISDVREDIPYVNVTLLFFDTESGNMSRAPIYRGEAVLELRNTSVQLVFDVNTGRSGVPSGSVEAYLVIGGFRLQAVGGNITLVKKVIGHHEAAVLSFREPLTVNVTTGNTSFTLEVREAALYSSALVHGSERIPANVTEKEIRGPDMFLYVIRGSLTVNGTRVELPYQLPPAVATYVLAVQQPGFAAFVEQLRSRAPDLYQLLSHPREIMNLTVDKACLAAPQGCVAFVKAPRLVPETAWLDLHLRVNDRRDFHVRIRFEAYGEIQGIHGLVSKVIHPSLGLDDVYVVVSPPTKRSMFLPDVSYHELLLYYLHEAFKRLEPRERLALAALMAAGYNIDTLNRLAPQRALERVEQSTVELYMLASNYNPAESAIAKEGLYVQVKVIPGVRLVWLGPVVMALSAVYAAALAVAAERMRARTAAGS